MTVADGAQPREPTDYEVGDGVAALSQRLERDAAERRMAAHYRRPAERAFTADERARVTVIIGGLTWKHERLLRSAFESAGYRVALLPCPDRESFHVGKQYSNNGQCNPTYFMVGSLIRFLRAREAEGLTRREIVDRYVFFTAGSCGPCRFGMYEAEYRAAVQAAGYDGFRILLFQQDDGIKAASGEPGLRFGIDFGLGVLNAFNFADALNDLACQIRPYERTAGATDAAMGQATAALANALRDRRMFRVEDRAPAWLAARILASRRLESLVHTSGKVVDHLWGAQTRRMLADARAALEDVEVDRLRVKPVVKVVGEFFAQTTEGDANFRMFEFLEREGAEVSLEPIATWVLYLLWQPRAQRADRKWVIMDRPRPWQIRRRLACELRFGARQLLFKSGERFYVHLYDKVRADLGGIGHPLPDMEELARLAHPYYHRFARGGEGHLEVAKSIYYTVRRRAHMVLSLKPFGCMPSTQSDGVHSAVMSHFSDMIFLPIETSGEGEVNAHSRVQMALGAARAKARSEFQAALDGVGVPLADLQDYVAGRPELRRPFYVVPDKAGVAGTAARFVWHLGDLLRRRSRAFVAVRSAFTWPVSRNDSTLG